jgi:hypothetical protein
VIPYAPSIVQAGKSSGLLNKKGDKKALKQEDFEENKTQLEQRVSIVEQGVIRCGIRTARLGTEEMIEVFYKLFNPGDVETSFNI